MTKGKVCAICPMGLSEGNAVVNIKDTDINLITLCGITNTEKKKTLKDIVGIPQSCNLATIQEKDSYNIEEVTRTKRRV